MLHCSISTPALVRYQVTWASLLQPAAGTALSELQLSTSSLFRRGATSLPPSDSSNALDCGRSLLSCHNHARSAHAMCWVGRVLPDWVSALARRQESGCLICDLVLEQDAAGAPIQSSNTSRVLWRSGT